MSVRCPRCGAGASPDETECSHCHLVFRWIRVAVPVDEDGTNVVVRAEVRTER